MLQMISNVRAVEIGFHEGPAGEVEVIGAIDVQRHQRSVVCNRPTSRDIEQMILQLDSKIVSSEALTVAECEVPALSIFVYYLYAIVNGRDSWDCLGEPEIIDSSLMARRERESLRKSHREVSA